MKLLPVALSGIRALWGVACLTAGLQSLAQAAGSLEVGTGPADLVPIASVEAEDAIMGLTLALAQFEHIQGRFTQRTEDASGRLLRWSSGKFWVQRPDRFRWESDQPFAEVLVGDGATLWLWDPDLEQVTIRPYDERLDGMPAHLLVGTAADLAESFAVNLLAADGGLEVFELRPRVGGSLVESLKVKLMNGQPQSLDIHDSLGQRTEIRLEEVALGLAVEPEVFTLSIPDGADVLREGEGSD